MYETADELRALQALVDSSFARASEHLRGIMASERRLTAAQIVAEVPSPAVLNIATVTALGEPRVSAVDGHLMHGRWYFTTAADSPKAVQLAARPAISASYTPRDGYGIFCHGRAVMLAPGDERQAIIDHFVVTYGQSPDEFGPDIAYVRIDADWLVGFAFSEAEMAGFVAEREERRARQG